MKKEIEIAELFISIKELIVKSRELAYRSTNTILLNMYWQMGQLIVEDEQNGNSKAVYGKSTLKNLSKALTLEFGKGFDYTNLTNMRNFYLAFPIIDAVRQELSWTHYRLLSRVDSEHKRMYYLNESIAGNWNSNSLQSNIKN